MIAAPGWTARDRVWRPPLDHADPAGPTIEVFAREVVANDRRGDDLPWRLFLQGGPGTAGPRPPAGWLPEALKTH